MGGVVVALHNILISGKSFDHPANRYCSDGFVGTGTEGRFQIGYWSLEIDPSWQLHVQSQQ